jgi:hypothetical protein
MDMRTGRMYATKEDALAAGVPESDIAEVLLSEGQSSILAKLRECPEVRFSSGPFKGRLYKRTESGNLVRVKD